MRRNKDENTSKNAEKGPSIQRERALIVPLRAKTMLLSITALVILVSCSAGIAVIRYTGAGNALFEAVNQIKKNTATTLGLTINEVLVTGRNEISRSELIAVLKIRRGDPILGFDPHAARERLLSIGWVADADVQRRLPNTIYVRITEQKPAAIWQHNGKFKLIARNGKVISKKISTQHRALKVLVGEDAPTYAAELIKMLETEHDLMKQVTHATRVGSRRWNLLLKQGINVRLPAENAETAWRYLATLQRDHRILQQEIRAVDLRVPNRLTVQVLQKHTSTRAGNET